MVSKLQISAFVMLPESVGIGMRSSMLQRWKIYFGREYITLYYHYTLCAEAALFAPFPILSALSIADITLAGFW